MGDMAFLDGLAANPEAKEMFDAKRILEDIILKMATKDIEEKKQRFLVLPLNEQKRILREYGLTRGVFSSGLHSLQKRLGYRNNSNSKTSLNFSKAQERYFKHLLESQSETIKLSMLNRPEPYKSVKKILDFDVMTYSVIRNPKMKIYEWLREIDRRSVFRNKPEVFQWAIDTYLMQEDELFMQEYELALREARRPEDEGMMAAEAAAGKWRGSVKLDNTSPYEIGITDGGGSRRKSQRRRRRTRRH